MMGMMRAILLLATLALVSAAELKRPDRVVGGDPVRDDDALWTVSLQSKSLHHFCGGALIRNDWVLTAAHCTLKKSPADIRVGLGSNKLSGMGEKYQVEKIIRNKDYNRTTMANDIALLKLKLDGRQQYKGTPLPLEEDEHLLDDNCFVTGFGRLSSGGKIPKVMMQAQVPIMPLAKCVDVFLAQGYRTITQGHVCAGGLARDACQGDSGGPLVRCSGRLRSEDGCRLVGVTSWGIGCATAGVPGVYTNVAHYKNWVDANMH